ncbi:hypothetical protein K9M48_02350 [Candidatus Gracilibacteria bacterium]|nr:hypothetical protein [Candidatus Gracilibacteria bacterium]
MKQGNKSNKKSDSSKQKNDNNKKQKNETKYLQSENAEIIIGYCGDKKSRYIQINSL